MKKFLCIATVIVAAAITLYYLSISGISGNKSAFSTVGITHPILFTVWGIATYIALGVNIAVSFEKTKYKFYIALLAVSLIGMVLTLCCDFDYDKKSEYMLHCIGSLMFSAVTGITVFLAFLLNKRYISAGICAAILIIDLIFLLIFKETSLIECVPIAAGYILLLANNLKKKREKVGA